ncbi:hypothetical protein BJ878DRAFT_425193 [Calycina marina]|uniref:Magnesium chelatase n=1 Tax=Calycina marina TaxID=1763456 RepID=A0A9P7Z0S5_9HELO|nr:hypothetical protein BJ878DRAFT_425193 [Calycina marina]
MADAILEKVHDLSDVELAALICLITKENCIIDTEPGSINDLVEELELVAAKVFGLSHAVIDCTEYTTLDDFAHTILSVDSSPTLSVSPLRSQSESYFLRSPGFRSITRSPQSENFDDNKSIANVIIAKNLDEAPKQVQIQALELIRTKRIYTRISVNNAPKTFLLIAVLAGGEGPRLTKHLNEYMFISHFHDPEDGFPNLEEMYDDGHSISSVVRKGPKLETEAALQPRISSAEIEHLSRLSDVAVISIEVKRYQQDVVAFLRLHRAVSSGITAIATQHFDKLMKCLAPLHGLSYATPSLVGLAARKIYLHRIHIVTPNRERSLQWGSDVETVAALLEGIGPEEVIEDVLGSSGAEVPL